MTANIYSRPILPLVAAMMTGIAFGSVHGGHRTWILTVCAAIFARLIYCIVRRKANAGAPLLLFAGLGYLLIQPWAAPVLPEHHVVHYTDGKNGVYQEASIPNHSSATTVPDSFSTSTPFPMLPSLIRSQAKSG